MKRLTLVRHAKAASPYASETDFERPLTDGGRQEAARVATRLAESPARPGRILSSPAPRARETAEILATALAFPRADIVFVRELYLADPATLLAVLARENAVDHVLLVGHNPGVSELLRYLAPVRGDDLPTAAVASVAFDRGVEPQAGRLEYFDHPLR